MTVYDENFIKDVMNFDDMLEGDWFKELDNPKEHTGFLEQPQWKIHSLQYAVRVLFMVIKTEMKETNRIHSILGKLPDTDEFKAIKQELKQIREEALASLIPIKKLSESMESSKNARPDYIG